MKNPLFYFFVILISGCQHNNIVQFEVISEHNLTVTQSKDSEGGSYISFSQLRVDNEPCCCYYNQNTNCLHIDNILDTNKKASIILDSFFIINALESTTSISVYSLDSIWIFLEKLNTLFLIDRNGCINLKYDFTSILDTANFAFANYSFSPFKVYNNNIVFTTPYKDVILNTNEKFLRYFERKSDVLIKVNSDCIISCKFISNFPSEYKKKMYDDFYPSRCFNKENQIVYSFAYSDSIYLYNSKGLLNTFPAKSKYVDKFTEFDLSKSMDANYVRTKAFENPKYSDIVYDTYRNCYYRVVKHSTTMQMNEWELKKKNDSNWSILVIDSTFKVVSEVLIPRSKYEMGCLLPTEAGLLIYNNNSSYINSIVCFSIIKLYEN